MVCYTHFIFCNIASPALSLIYHSTVFNLHCHLSFSEWRGRTVSSQSCSITAECAEYNLTLMSHIVCVCVCVIFCPLLFSYTMWPWFPAQLCACMCIPYWLCINQLIKNLRFQMGRHSLTSWFMICHIHFTFHHLSAETWGSGMASSDQQALKEF